MKPGQDKQNVPQYIGALLQRCRALTATKQSVLVVVLDDQSEIMDLLPEYVGEAGDEPCPAVVVGVPEPSVNLDEWLEQVMQRHEAGKIDDAGLQAAREKYDAWNNTEQDRLMKLGTTAMLAVVQEFRSRGYNLSPHQVLCDLLAAASTELAEVLDAEEAGEDQSQD